MRGQSEYRGLNLRALRKTPLGHYLTNHTIQQSAYVGGSMFYPWEVLNRLGVQFDFEARTIQVPDDFPLVALSSTQERKTVTEKVCTTETSLLSWCEG